MTKRSVEDVTRSLVLPIVNEKGFELVDVEYLKEGSEWYLRVYIDKDNGITLDDCQAVSEELSKILDEVNPIKRRYYLEVSSPGLVERPLKSDRDFEKQKGKLVEIKLYQPFKEKKVFEGELIGLINNNIVIKTEKDEIIEFEREKVALVKRAIKF